MAPRTETEEMDDEENPDEESQSEDEEQVEQASVHEQESEEKVESAPIKVKPVTIKKRRKHKPKDFPKRPLSAYNIFFKETREVMLKEKEREVGKDNVDFQSMVKDIAKKWKALAPAGRERVEMMAKEDLARYKDEVRAYEEELVQRNRREREEIAMKKRKLEEDEANSRAAKEEKDRIVAAAENAQARAGQMELQRRYYDDQYGVSESAGVGAGAAASIEDLRRILEDEILQIEAIRELKLRQLAELQAGIIPHSFSSVGLGGALGASPGMLGGGLGGGLSVEAEMELLRRRHGLTSSGGLGFGGGGAVGSLGRSPMVSDLDIIRSGHSGATAGVLLGGGAGAYGDPFLLAQHQGGGAGLGGLSRPELAMREEAMLRSLREREHQDLVLSSRLAAAAGERRGAMADWEVERRAAAEHRARLEEEELLRRAGRVGAGGDTFLAQHLAHAGSRGHAHTPAGNARRDVGGFDHRESHGAGSRVRGRDDGRGTP
jgi:hypothetical protein